MEIIKEYTCCFAGHRELSHEPAVIYSALETETERKIYAGYRDFITGGARGFDSIAAEAVLQLRERMKPYFTIRLIVALPCPPAEQTKFWCDGDRKKYENILSRADKTVIVSPHYYKGCMLKRNDYLVDSSAACVCYLTNEKRSGTSYTVNRAKQKGLEVVFSCP